MKLVIQTLGHQQADIDVDPAVDTFDDLRQKIRTHFKFPENCGITLIHATKVINKTDAKISTVDKIKAGDKIVMMKKKETAAPSAAAPAPVEAPSPAAAGAPSPAVVAPVPSPAAAPTAEAAPAGDVTTTTAPAPEPVPAPVAAIPSPTAPTGSPAAPVTAVPTVEVGGPQQAAPPTDLTNSLLMGTAAEEAISNMVSMGFPRDQVVLALRAAFNNPDRAVEYLLSGNIPAVEPAGAPPPTGAPVAPPAPTTTGSPAAPQAPPVPPPRPTQPVPPQTDEPFPGMEQEGTRRATADEADMEEEAGTYGDEMEDEDEDEDEGMAVMNQEMVQQLRQMLMQDPSALPALLQQIGQTNPELMQLIQAEPELFFRMLGAGSMGGGRGGGAGGNLPEGRPPGAVEIHLTQEEMETIQRIESLGFPRNAVIQAFLACEKDENATANFLFDNPEWARDQGDNAEGEGGANPPAGGGTN